MGLIKKPSIPSYWDEVHASQSTPWFVEHFNRDRFQLLLKFLHFANNENTPAADHVDYKLFKVKKIVEHFQSKFKKMYVPHQDVAIDESMVGYRGKTPHLRQYMPNKHHARFGIKLWCVCDSTSKYTSYFEVYKGQHEGDVGGDHGVTYSLVMRLMKESDLLSQGYHLSLDNYFTSPQLFLDLFADNTSATGTVRRNRKGLPKLLLKEKLANRESKARRKGPLLCIVYKDNSKVPVLLSTKDIHTQQHVRNARGRDIVRPAVINRYNKCMGGVDCSDAMLYAYLAERRTMKWTHKLVFALIGRAALNAYILYAAHTSAQPKLDRHHFLIEVVEGLMSTWKPGKTCRKRRSKTEIAAARATPQPQNLNPPEHHLAPEVTNCKLEKIGEGRRR